jgi:epoxyqueuosine reductase
MEVLLMIEAKKVKEFAREQGADLVGVASVDRLTGAPEGHRPEDFLSGANSVIAMAKRIPLGIVKTIPIPYYYASFGYHDINASLRALASRVALYLEDQGYAAFPTDPSVDRRAREVKIISEEPEIKIKILGDFSQRHAMAMAGLGEISASGMFVAPKFGPRIRLVSVITTAAFEPDPLPPQKGQFNVCKPNLCGSLCIKKCPAKAIPGDGTVDHYRCRYYRNPQTYTLEYWKELSEGKKTGKYTSLTAKAEGHDPGCGICMKTCPLGIDF